MAIRPIILAPNSLLKTACAPVEKFDEDLRNIVRDLEDTRADSLGCVGIAAPQLGVLQRVAIVDTSQHKKHGAASSGYLVLVNPIITKTEDEKVGREGCLSIPDFTANVRRAVCVDVEYSQPDGTRCTLSARGFEAVVIQHEIDHLDGILFLDRVANLATDIFPRKVSAK